MGKVYIYVKDSANKKLAEYFFDSPLFDDSNKGKKYNIYLRETGYQEQYTGTHTVKTTLPITPTPTCPPGQHWDSTLQKCVDDVVVPPTCPPGQHWDATLQQCVPDVVTTGVLWDSNIHGKWNDGVVRTITKKQGGQTTDDKSIFVAASGSPKLVIDGNGIAHLVSGSGGVSNLSLKGDCMHQGNISPLTSDAPSEGSKRGGGEGFSISHDAWNCKREKYHNEHDSLGSGSLPKKVEDNKWHKVKFTWKHDDVARKIKLTGSIDYLDGQGYRQVMSITDSNAEAWFFVKGVNIYIWIRLNNSDHGRIYIMAYNYDASLEMDFMFEPSRNSIALRNVKLVAI